MRAKSLQWSPTPCDPMDCLSMRFSREEQWSGLPCPPPGDLPKSGINPTSPASPVLQADSLPSEALGKPKNTGVSSLSFL